MNQLKVDFKEFVQALFTSGIIYLEVLVDAGSTGIRLFCFQQRG